MEEVKIKSEYITLGQFLKFKDIISMGSEVKIFLATNDIYVNGELENRRGKKLFPGDEILVGENLYKIC